MYTKDERIEILNWYKTSNLSLRGVRDMFSAKYPERPIPSIGTIITIIKKLILRDVSLISIIKK